MVRAGIVYCRWLFLMLLGSTSGCVINNDDRCVSGYFFVSDFGVCCPEDHVYDKEGGRCRCPDGETYGPDGLTCIEKTPVDSDGTGDTDDTDVDGGGEEKPSGLGNECTSHAQCAEFKEDYCAQNPLKPVGYCTDKDCDSTDDCGEGYTCCDCLSSTIVDQAVACLADADATLASSVAGCTCN